MCEGDNVVKVACYVPVTADIMRDGLWHQIVMSQGKLAEGNLRVCREAWPDQDWSEFEEPIRWALDNEAKFEADLHRALDRALNAD